MSLSHYKSGQGGSQQRFLRTPQVVLKTAALSALLGFTALSPAFGAEDGPELHSVNDVDRLLAVPFDSREVVKIEAGSFYFTKDQPAPIHSHVAPAIGYIAKGSILYQVEGEAPRLLKKGDAFYEPVGQRIVHFDNASTTEDAIFVDFNLQQAGEPFIVFETPPTEAIDRRALSTAHLQASAVSGVTVYGHRIEPNARQVLDGARQLLGYVTEGVVELRVKGKPVQRIKAGENFYQLTEGTKAVLLNASSERPAKVIVFSLHKS